MADEGRDETADRALDDRLAAAGMYTVAQMMGVTPMTRWITHAGMDSLGFFETWLDRRAAEFLRMKAAYELGDKDKDDELYEWVLAHGAAFSEARTNLKAALAGSVGKDGLPPVPEWVVANGLDGSGREYRMWGGRSWIWTHAITHATRFARRRDAEQILPDGDEHGCVVVDARLEPRRTRPGRGAEA
jgi:hypothetical protein